MTASGALTALAVIALLLVLWLQFGSPSTIAPVATSPVIFEPAPAAPDATTATATANGTTSPATSSEPLPAIAQDFYVLRTVEIDNGRRHYIRNLIAGPLQFELKFDRAQGVVANPTLPLRVTVPSLAEVAVVDVMLAPDAREATFSLLGEAVPGSPNAVHSAAARYVVPFDPEIRWSLDQGFDGTFSHHDVQARYALDFGVPLDTPVLAAREGVVMHVRGDFETASTADDRYAERANTVRVLHDDGTMGVYAHLAPRSIGVRVGQRVAAGEPLALSGNTGYSTGPHLHFAVQRNTGMKLESIPFDMVDVNERRPD